METIEKTFRATTDELPNVLAFVEEHLESHDAKMKAVMQLDIAVEELFVNIAHYAYEGVEGDALIRLEFKDNRVIITFIDSGFYFDPVSKEDPDITKAADERDVGGLGIYMVKKSMDAFYYKRVNDQNVLTIEKEI